VVYSQKSENKTMLMAIFQMYLVSEEMFGTFERLEMIQISANKLVVSEFLLLSNMNYFYARFER